jgi:hypothetical protein
MRRAVTEGDGYVVSTSLFVWMIERYRKLVGIPVNEPLNGQLIPQSPNKCQGLTEDDYLEALGIERMYTALINAEQRPDHLVYLAHALGRAAKENNILSDSTSTTQSLDKMPSRSMLSDSVTGSMDHAGAIGCLSEFHNSIKFTDTDDKDGYESNLASPTNQASYDQYDRDISVSDDVWTAHAAVALDHMVIHSDITGSAGESTCVAGADDNCMHIDVHDNPTPMMDTEANKNGHGPDNRGDSREDTKGNVKRNREDYLDVSPTVVLLLSFDNGV